MSCEGTPISQLPGVTIPYSGTELFALAQSGTTRAGTLLSLRDYIGADLSSFTALTGNWEDTYITVDAKEFLWDNAYDLVFSSQPKWDSAYTTVSANSAAWGSAANYDHTLIESTSSNWNSTYTTVSANSAIWSDHFDSTLIENTSSNWDSTYTTVSTSSASWAASGGGGTTQNASNLAISATNEGTVSGNGRAANSVDLQTDRTNPLNVASGSHSVVGGGKDNKSTNGYDVVAGGLRNSSGGGGSAVIGGTDNVASGGDASVLGGKFNVADSSYSVAAGYKAKTNNQIGSFVFADSTNNDFLALSSNSFNIRAAGGLRLVDGNEGAGKILVSDASGTGHWRDPFSHTLIESASANWDSTYTTVSANSAAWDAHTDPYDDSLLQTTSANWDSTYTTVSANSASWGGGGGGSSTLSEVGVGSTTLSDSTYTLTNNVDVKFNSSEGNPIFKLDESAESILIGADSHTITGRENKLYIEGDGNTTLTRTQFAVKNTGPASAAAFDMICSDGGAISIQASGPGYGGGHKAWVYSYEGLPLYLASDGDIQNGGLNDISFSPGGWDNTSVWFKPSGNVGIGTSLPSTALHIEKDMGPSGGEGIYLRNTNANGFSEVVFDNNITNTGGGFVFGYGGTGTGSPDHAYFWNRKPGPIRFGTDATERLRIDAGGNVGIGTTSPGAKLEVAGQVKITGGAPGSGKVLTSDATGLASWVLPTGGGSVGTLQTVTNNGNTTTNPIEFNIGGAGQEFIKINATASSGRPLTFYDNGSFVGGIDYNFTGNYWSFDVSDSLGSRVTDAFTIQSETDDNFIGLGTTLPDAKLHINASAINGRETLLKGSISDAGDDAFYLGNGTSGNGSFMPRFAGYVNSSNGGYSQSFWGLTNIASDASDSSLFGLTHFAAMRSGGLPSDPTNGTLSEIENRKLYTFGGSGTNIYMTMAAGGNLGLGTGEPDAPLHINASAINGRENLIKGSVSDNTNDAFYLGNGTSQTNCFVPRFAGYVDSFNNKPSSQFWGLTNSASDVSDSSSIGLINFAAGISSNATDPTNGTLTPVLNRKLFTFADISGSTNHMTIAAGGNVGFGTDTPEAKVDVSGRMRFQSTTEPAPTTGRGFEAFYSTSSDKSFFVSVDRDPGTDILKGIDMRGSSFEFWTGADLNNDAIRLKVEDDGVEFLESVRILNPSAGAPAFRCLDTLNANFRIQSSLRNGSQNTSFNIDAVGQPGDANRETLVFGYFQTPDKYKIASVQTGSGVLHPIRFEMGWDAPVMTIATDGNIGIGTETPDKALNITGSGAKSTLKITDNGTGSAAAEMYIDSNDGWSFYNERSTKNFNIRETITGGSIINVDRLTINQGGNIGIGTTSPTAKLEVAGQVKITGGSPGTGKVLTSDAGGTASWVLPTGGTGGAAVSAAPTAETSIYIDAGGLLGTDGGASASTGGDAGTNNSTDWWNVDVTEELFSKIAMPPQWDGGDVDVEFFWTINGANTGDNVQWGAAATSAGNGEVWDSVFSAVTETGDDLLIANDEIHVVKATGITPAGTPADGNLLFLKLQRTSTTGQTASVDARLLGVRVHYKNLVHRNWYINKMGGEDVEADAIISEKTAWIAPANGIIYGVHSGVSTIPSAAGISIDVKAAGNSILSVLGVIAAGESSSDQGSSTSHVIQGGSYSFSKGDRISFEIDSFGGTGGKGLHTDLQISWAQ